MNSYGPDDEHPVSSLGVDLEMLPGHGRSKRQDRHPLVRGRAMPDLLG